MFEYPRNIGQIKESTHLRPVYLKVKFWAKHIPLMNMITPLDISVEATKGIWCPAQGLAPSDKHTINIECNPKWIPVKNPFKPMLDRYTGKMHSINFQCQQWYKRTYPTGIQMVILVNYWYLALITWGNLCTIESLFRSLTVLGGYLILLLTSQSGFWRRIRSKKPPIPGFWESLQ